MDIKYAYYNTSKGYRVLGGTAVHFLKADGSLDGTEYIDKTSFQDIAGTKRFYTSGGNNYDNNNLHIASSDGSDPAITFNKIGTIAGQLKMNVAGYHFLNPGLGYYPVNAAGYVKSGSDDTYLLTGGGNHIPISNFAGNNYSTYQDNREISPNEIGPSKFVYGFTSWNNNNVYPWADFIHFGGYQDSSGGNQNLIVFNRNGYGLRQYQADWQDSSPYTNHVDYWHTGNFTQANVDSWNNMVYDYVTLGTQQTITGIKEFYTNGSSEDWTNNRLRIIGAGGKFAGLSFYSDGFDIGQINFNGGFHFFNESGNGYKQIKTAGFIKDGSSNDYLLRGGGDHVPMSDFALTSQLGNYHKIDAVGGINNGSSGRVNTTWFDYGWAGTDKSGSVINFSGLYGGYSSELFVQYNNNGQDIGVRSYNGDANAWNTPHWLWHSGNFDPAKYLTSRGLWNTGATAIPDYPNSVTVYAGDPAITNFPSFYGTSLHIRGDYSWHNRLDFPTGAEKLFLYQGINTTDMSFRGYIDLIPAGVTNWTSNNFNPSNFVTIDTPQTIIADKNFAPTAKLTILGTEINQSNNTQSYNTSSGTGNILSGWLHTFYGNIWKYGMVRGGDSSSTGVKFGFDFSSDGGASYNRMLSIDANDGHLELKNGGVIKPNGDIVVRQSNAGANATGLFWYNNAYTDLQSGIGTYTENGDSIFSYIGWGSSPWLTANALVVGDSLFAYKDNVVWHAGNFNPNIKANALENGTGIGFSAGVYPTDDGNEYPYMFHGNPGNNTPFVPLATQGFVNSKLSALNNKDSAWLHSGRDFTQGTRILTNIDYSQVQGAAFLLEIKGNMYGGGMVMDCKVQGYIYNNTIINQAGYSTHPLLTEIIALNLNGELCFWFPRLSYWQGFSVKVTDVTYAGVTATTNRAYQIADAADPGGIKRVSIPIATVATQNWINGQSFVTTNTVQAITALKEFYATLAMANGQSIYLKGSSDTAHYIRHFSDDTDGFGVSSGFAVKNYSTLENLLKVTIAGFGEFKQNVRAGGFLKTGSSNNFVLLGYGDHKPLSDFFTTTNFNPANKVDAWENATAIGFTSGLSSQLPYIYHKTDGYVFLATQNYVNANFALRDGSNATDIWRNASHLLSLNPDASSGKIFNASGLSSLLDATYGNGAGVINTPGNGGPTAQWYHRIKMLHGNASGYYTEMAIQMTGGNSFWYKRYENGTDYGWTQVWDKENLTPAHTGLWDLAYNYTLNDVLNYNANDGDVTRYIRQDGSSFDRTRRGISVIDARVTGNGLGSNGSPAYIPNPQLTTLNNKVLPLFHTTSQYGGGYATSLITKGWTDNYKAWRITGPGDNNNIEQDFFLSQSRSDTGAWFSDRKIWTDRHFTQANINSWNSMTNSSIQLNVEFTTNLGTGLMLSDDRIGGESGLIDIHQKAFIAGKINEYYKYGSSIYGVEGINYNCKTQLFGMGREANKTDKLTVEGSVKASQNFKSEDEEADTMFIPDGQLATLRDEIINEKYAIRLDPHEYEIDAYSTLEVDDRNRLIHIIGEQVEMRVNFNKIYPKQQIVIYNFDQKDLAIEVQIYGQARYKVEARSFLRLYVTNSLRVIAERLQPCEFIW